MPAGPATRISFFMGVFLRISRRKRTNKSVKEVTLLFVFFAQLFLLLPMILFDEFCPFAAFIVATGLSGLNPGAENEEIEDEENGEENQRENDAINRLHWNVSTI